MAGKRVRADLWIDRDLSWLDFNERVLAEALDRRNALLERAKFLAIFTSNLDEFFMKRVAVLRQPLTADREKLLQEINVRLLPALHTQAACFREQIVPGLASHGVFLRHWEELTVAQMNEAKAFFDKEVSPALTPLVIHSGESFPFLSNLSTSLVFPIADSENGEHLYARVKVPADLKHWVPLEADLGPDRLVYVRLHEVIRENLDKLYPGMQVGATTLVRLTRDAEVEEAENANGSVLDQVREQVRKRRYEPVVRLEFAGDANPAIRELLRDHFGLRPADLYEASDELDYTTLFELGSIHKQGLSDAPWTPVAPHGLREEHADIFSAIREGDILVHHPYEWFDGSVERFIKEAANDPADRGGEDDRVPGGDDTPFVKSLVRAAEAGKQVACVMELKARFDEERICIGRRRCARRARTWRSGKGTTRRMARRRWSVRKEAVDTLSARGHGNYRVRTARLYADCGLSTCDPAVTKMSSRCFIF